MHNRASVKGILWLDEGFKRVAKKIGTITCLSTFISLPLDWVTWLYWLVNRAKPAYGGIIARSWLNLSILESCSRKDITQSIKYLSIPWWMVWSISGTIIVIRDISVRKRSVYATSGPGSDRKNSSVRSQTRLKTRPGASWPAKPVPVHGNRWVLPGLARPVGSSLRFLFSGFSIYDRIQICYCYVQNINFGTSFSVFVSLAAFIIETRRDMLPATFWSWVWTMVRLASLVRFEVQNSYIDS